MAIKGLGLLTICILHMPAFNTQQHLTEQVLQNGLRACNIDRFCSTTLEHKVDTGVNGSCCNKCFCSEDCWLFGDCCPDAPVPNTPSTFGDIMPVCFSNLVDISGTRNKTVTESESEFYRMIIKCPSGNSTDNQTIELCEDPFGNLFSRFNFSLKNVVPVSNHEGFIFRNVHCARCHGITDVQFWKLGVKDCHNRIDFEATAGYLDTKFLVNECLLFARPPDGVDVYRSYCHKSAISSCPIIGDRFTYQIFADACHFSSFPAEIEVTRGDLLYRNIFCLLCNERNQLSLPVLCKSISSVRIELPPHHVMMDVNVSSKMAAVKPDKPTGAGQCSARQVRDHIMNVCRDLKCNFAQIPEHGVCVESGYHWYETALYVWLLVTVEDMDISPTLAKLNQTDGYGLEPITSTFIRILGLADVCGVCPVNPVYSSNIGNEFFINFGLLLSSNCTYERIEEEVTNLKETIAKTRILFDENESATISYRLFPTPNIGHGLFTAKQCDGYSMKKLYHCPFIVLSDMEYCTWQGHQISPNKGSCISSLDLFENNSSFEVYVDNGHTSVGVCLSEYLPKVVQTSSNIAGILSLACTCLSMLCTSITVMMIWSRQQLKSFPMFVLIIGMVTHFAAQGLFQFGIGWPEVEYLCPIIGGLIHYFWLATVFAFNAYCVSVYHSLRQTNIKIFTRKVILLFVCYIFVLPLFFIAVNIIYSIRSSDEASISSGYGQIQCFINSPLMRGVVFAVPILTAVFANCIVYLGIVYLVQKQANFSKSVGIRTHYATSYFRLLVLTGVTWLIGYLNEAFPNDVLGYIFIVCFGCQGVFVLLAFAYRPKQKSGSVAQASTALKSN